VSWLYGQTWLWYLIAFLVGLVLAWLVFVRPAQRRLAALLAEPSSAGDGRADAAAGGTAGSSRGPTAGGTAHTGGAGTAVARLGRGRVARRCRRRSRRDGRGRGRGDRADQVGGTRRLQ
jgi:hypothetical protein